MSLEDPIRPSLFPIDLSDGTVATLGIGFAGGDPDEGRAGLFLDSGKPTRADGTTYFTDVATWQDCVNYDDRLKTDFHHSEDEVFEELETASVSVRENQDSGSDFIRTESVSLLQKHSVLARAKS
jgi:hypothetical protein